ncbi:tRNA uridine(34) 5-carboxymethylaminomethyl modification radical SAM/GNAT enzyme Elp3 [Patescibacteria group bacterium]|nr:tRNA uridine(34) 5-carboxymethylaminomethyl modification radical SAM/GNAT enzyme Elp3 [Patescibacteria group bacterium]
MPSKLEKIILQLTRADIKTRADLVVTKRKITNSLKIPPPQNSDLIKTYRKLLKAKKIKENKTLFSLLKKREIRTLSGVAPIAVLTKSYPCPGKCIYCPTENKMPKSYLSNEPAVMRAILNKFDPYKQVEMRLLALQANGHPTDKCELIILGGTWSALTKPYQTKFIKRCLDAMNKKAADDLPTAQKRNERAKHRCIGITIETRPDYITVDEIKRLRELGVTKVELGVQNLNDSILKINRRGHNVKQTIQATKLLKDTGFKVGYHLMSNLLGATLRSDLAMFKKLFSDDKFKPDYLKLYPCVVTKNTKLFTLWKQGKYKPHTDKQLRNLIINIKKIVPYYVRISRVIRDIPTESIIAGNKISNLRQLLADDLKEKMIVCKCIRCREVGHQQNITNTFSRRRLASLRGRSGRLAETKQLRIKKYSASDGIEYFLSFESNAGKVLYAFLRLRIPRLINSDLTTLLPELENAALIRELHTYGHLTPIDKKGKVQHTGMGKKLMLEAEKICKKHNVNKITIISGVGVRPYYKKLGYKLENTYMTKSL